MKPLHTVRRAARAGFSLAELMVVIVIIGLLATFVVPKLMDRFASAQVQKAKVDIKAIADAVLEYRLRNGGRLPPSIEDLVTPDENGYQYLDRDTVPKDPWGNEYVYEQPPAGEKDPLIWTFGSDGAQGGDGDARDFNNRMIKNQEI